MSAGGTRTRRCAARLGLALAFSASCLASAQEVLGPNKCTTCHDHELQKTWAEKKEGPKGHLNALAQLEDKRAAGWGKAIGLADVYDLGGACVKCHATVFKKDANAGVSCESCHGAGSGYLEAHQQKGSYQKAVGLGMYDTRGNYGLWAKLCLDCHILNDGRLAAAGHPTGKGFDLGEKAFGVVVHWKPAYDRTVLAAAGRAYVPGKAVPARAIPEAIAVAKVEPPKAPPAATPAAVAAAPASAPGAAAKTGAAQAAAPRATAVREPNVAAAAAPPVGRAPRAAAPAPPLAAASAAPAPAPPSLVELPPGDGVVSRAAALRGRVLLALAAAIRDGRPVAVAPGLAQQLPAYNGPDGELLRLQDEVLALEVALLARPAPPKTAAKEKK